MILWLSVKNEHLLRGRGVAKAGEMRCTHTKKRTAWQEKSAEQGPAPASQRRREAAWVCFFKKNAPGDCPARCVGCHNSTATIIQPYKFC
jgi:hypothetical protein